MKLINRIPVLGRLIREDKGQALVFTAVVLTSFVGVMGIGVDAGKGYYAYQLLKASTNAAALAGAAGLPDQSTATTYANDYGSKLSQLNANGVLTGVTTVSHFGCSATVISDFYAECAADTGGSGAAANTIQVTQTAVVPTWIGPLFGVPSFHIQDVSTAAWKGGNPTPYNIAVVLDTTASMQDADNGLNNGVGGTSCSSQIACAEAGVVVFLKELVPGTTASPVDLVSLYVFPGATSTSMANDYACNGTNPSSVPYTFQSATTTTLPSGDSYNVLNKAASGVWSGDYQVSVGTLNTSSDVVKSVGGSSGCGAGAPGGEGTYYAQVIYQAQSDLVAEKVVDKNPNMMIILSDGDATACNTVLATTGGTTTTNTCSGSGSSQITQASGTLNGTGLKATHGMSPAACNPNGTTTCTGYLSYQYPSALGECGQAVVAAQAASAAGTTVYTIGYGSESTGCTTDATYSATVTSSSSGYGANNWAPGKGPCAALGAMASAGEDFFSDNYHNNCLATDTKNQDLTSLKSIFGAIWTKLTSARLIPNANFQT